ncbi:MAG: hypothetical protein ACI4RG_08570 [Huintestinicola sp.]
MAKADQLCWSCVKACDGKGCPWADKLKPVEGWAAEPAIIRGNGTVIETYSIPIARCMRKDDERMR